MEPRGKAILPSKPLIRCSFSNLLQLLQYQVFVAVRKRRGRGQSAACRVSAFDPLRTLVRQHIEYGTSWRSNKPAQEDCLGIVPNPQSSGRAGSMSMIPAGPRVTTSA